MNPNDLYLQQQQYFAQFKQQTYEVQQQQLLQLGYNKENKNLKLLKQYNGDVNKVIQEYQSKKSGALDPQIIQSTKILLLDCNNLKYAHKKWNKFKSKPKLQIRKMIKKTLKWRQLEHNQLQHVQLMWDYFKFNCLKMKNDDNKIENEQLKEILQIINAQPQQQQQVEFNYQNVRYVIQETAPYVADDVIVAMLSGQVNTNTTVVTSDRELRRRLIDVGVQNFIGNGQFWKLFKE
ncbi:hypothetical protein pb186bvf_018880 [Paramecium bursaria]